jgi:hypothetical protein
MAMEYGEDFTMILISVSGGILKQKATVYIRGRMVIDTKVSGSIV